MIVCPLANHVWAYIARQCPRSYNEINTLILLLVWDNADALILFLFCACDTQNRVFIDRCPSHLVL